MQRFYWLIFFIAFTIVSNVVGAAKSPHSLTIMTFNIENGGTQINFNKVVAAIKQSNADVVGIQEAWGNLERLAQALQWRYVSRRLHIVSRHPLLEVSKYPHYLFIETMPGKVVAMANIHLPDEPYGPERIQAGDSMETVSQIEERSRLDFILPTLQQLHDLARHHVPVFVTGDFNSPSHLDWQANSIKQFPHHRYAMPWPVTSQLQQFGFVDAYRNIHPDLAKYPGFTWPAARPKALHSFDGYNPSASDLPDRIDFIFASHDARAIASNIVSEKEITPWPSDHRAVVATFVVAPINLSTLSQFLGETPHPLPLLSHLKPNISVSATRVKTGEPFAIKWRNAPGYGNDYIRITPAHTRKLAWGEAVRLYLHATTNGTILYNLQNAQGNWQAWYKGEEGHWPMRPGKYDIKLMLDDGEDVLAATSIIVDP